MPKKNDKSKKIEQMSEIQAFSGASPTPIAVGSTNESYTSADGLKIYLNFSDADSTGIFPLSGIERRFSITKIIGGSATTVIPISFFVDNQFPKTAELTLLSSDAIIDSLYDLSGVATTAQEVKVSYTSSTSGGFGTIPLLSDNDNLKSFVNSFTGLGISNRTEEANAPVPLYAYSDTSGNTVYVVFREANYPLLPISGIGGFSVVQGNNEKTILNSRILDYTDPNESKIVAIDLQTPIKVSNEGSVTVSYTKPSISSLRLRDSTTRVNETNTFTGLAVTNLVDEIISPKIVRTFTSNSDPQKIFITMSEPTLPGSGITGFSFYNDNVGLAITSVSVGNTSYGGLGVSQYTFTFSSKFSQTSNLELDYIKPTTNFITDQSDNLNALQTLSNRIVVDNLYQDLNLNNDGNIVDPLIGIATSQNQDISYVDTNGLDIYLFFDLNRNYTVLPLTGITGFAIYVDGEKYPIKSAVASPASEKHHVKISLNARIHEGSVVKVGYFNGNLTDYNSVNFANFEPVEILNNSFLHKEELFDILDWNSKTKNDFKYNFVINENTSDLFRKSTFHINNSLILDTEPPKGIAIINRASNENQTGIKIHKFKAYGLNIESKGTEQDFDITSTTLAWKVNLSTTTTISELNLRLKYTNAILNLSDKVRIDLYSNSSDDKPGELLSNIGTILFANINTSYSDIPVDLLNTVTLQSGTNYWFSVSCDFLVPVNISFTPSISISYHSSQGDVIAETSEETTSGWLTTDDFVPYYNIFANKDIDIELSSNDYILDIFEKPIREAEYYDNQQFDKYELIGDAQSNFLLKKLNKIYEDTTNFDNDIYPKVSKIELGVSSNKPKNYVLEFRQSPNSKWVKLFDTLVDETTLDNLIYNFDTPVEISDLRIVYKGDYFTIDSKADLTIAAKDDLSQVVSAQISHFSDFRDAKIFENADSNGFIDFSEGLTEYLNWDLSNNSLVFKPKDGVADAEITTSVAYNNKILLASNNKIFSFFNDETVSISNDFINNENYQITCFASYKNRLYLGTNDGYLYATNTGDYWSIVNGVNPYDIVSKTIKNIDPITSLSVFGDKLYIGTKKKNNLHPTLYVFDGKGLKKFKEFDSSFDQISSIASANYNLYVGLGGQFGSSLSSIYSYDGVDWEESLSTKFDNVEALSFSTARNSIVASFRGGDIWENPFVNNVLTSWSKIYDTNADKTFSINDDPTGKYLFICCDNKSVIYVKETNSFKVITSYNSEVSGLNIEHKQYQNSSFASTTDITELESFSLRKYQTINEDINFTELQSISIGNTYAAYQNIKLQGYFKALEDGEYKFKLVSNLPSKLTIGGIGITSNYHLISSLVPLTLETPRTWKMNANELLSFQIDSFDLASTGATQYRVFELYHNNIAGINGYQIVEQENITRPSFVKNIIHSNSKYYGIGADGKVYEFDADFYATKLRNVYVRFKDKAGNLHGIVLPGKDEAAEILTDKITIDLNTVDTAYQTKGKIYQLQKNDDNTLVTKTIYTPSSRLYNIYAPNRKVKEFGYYETQPFYVPTLVKWNTMTNLIVNKYAINKYNGVELEGLDAGTAVRVYVRSGNTRTDCLNSSWSDPYEISYINNNSAIPPIETQEINLESLNGKWLQYKFELISATRNLTPEILSTTITYTAGTASYYFTKVFNTSDYDSNAPVIRRGVLTSNELLNNGSISYGYITSDDPADVYDFNKYKEIIPNKMFEIDSPTSKIKFGILFTSVGNNPSVVYDFAVQLDLGDKNIKFMPSL